MNKGFLFGITISLLLLCCTLPAAASDTSLGIFGNANEDETINMQDVEYTERIVLGHNDRTELADAKYDGEIDILDVIEIELIMLGKEKELTLIDGTQRTVTIYKPIERIAVFNIDTYVTLRAINATDKVVAVGKFTPRIAVLFPEFSDYPTFGSTWKPDYEALLYLNPDVVFIYGESVSIADNVVEKLNELDPSLTVIRFDCLYPSTYTDEVTKLGYILDKEEKAKELVDFYEEHLNSIKVKVEGLSEDEKPEVYFEQWEPYYTVGTGTASHEMIIAAGGKNIFGNISGNKIRIDKEAAIYSNPAIIIRNERLGPNSYVSDNITLLSDIKNEIMSRPELAKVNAVEDGKVYVMKVEVISGPLYFVGRAYMAKWFHPDIFEDLYPQAIFQEYLTKFQRLDYDLDEHRVFVYPPLEEI